MLSKNLENTLRKAIDIAKNYSHEYATLEHLLLAIMHDEDVHDFLKKNNIDAHTVISDLEYYIRHNLINLSNGEKCEPKRSAEFKIVLQRSEKYADVVGAGEINALYLLAEIYLLHKTYAAKSLKNLPTSRGEIIKYLDKNSYLFPQFSQEPEIHVKNLHEGFIEDKSFKPFKPEPENKDDPSILESFCTNLNLKAREGAIDLLIGRDEEIHRAIEVLVRRKKNNVILVGEPGVGKTAIAEGLALRITKEDVPQALKNSIIYSLDIGSLVAGTKFRGDFEDRINKMLKELKEKECAILFIDEIHTIMGAGSTSTGSLDASNLLKPAFARGDIRCIGATTFKEYHAHFEKDSALARRFQKIIVKEPAPEDCIKILMGLKDYYEKHHNVKYTNEAIKAAVVLSVKFIKSRKLPDKAIDLIDEAGARHKLLNDNNPISLKNIEELVASITGIPQINISVGEIESLQFLEQNLKNQIFGQDEAIETICDNIMLSKAGLKNGERPIGCYLFAGASGVGKTSLAKNIAKFCNMELVKLDMSEYSEKHSISSLIGSPTGYEGSKEGGILTEAVNNAAYSVVLFDEIEKAHREIFNLLLQVMDEGKLTDAAGKIVDFTNTIVILTTNLGTSAQMKEPLGFYNDKQEVKILKNKESIDVIEKEFSPEFINRLDNIIIFNKLNINIINRIIDKYLHEFILSLSKKNIVISIEKSVNQYLINGSNIEKKGVRGLEKFFEQSIKQKIAEELLFGRLREGGRVILSAQNNKLNFKFIKNPIIKAVEVS